MILGFGLLAGGYAVFYWGLHHFCNVDCIKGQQNQNGCCDNRVSLLTALGVPTKWDIQAAPAVQLNPLQTGNSSTQNQPGSPGAAPPNSPTQPQSANNNQTPSSLGGTSSNNLPGLVPSQSPTIPQGAYLNQNYSQPDIGAAIPYGYTGGAQQPSVVQPKLSWGQDFLNWGKTLFANPTSPLSIAKKDIQGIWHDLTELF